MKLINLILFLQNLFNAIADNCDSNNGYVLCENTNTCIQPYLTPCKDYYRNCDDCLNKQRNGIGIACPNSCNTKIINIDNDINNCNTIVPICNYNYVCPKILSCEDNNINNYITYILKLTINSNLDILNIYALYGDENNIMSIPPSYQSNSNSYGTNIGGIPNNIIRFLPDSKYDSYLTLGITDGNIHNDINSIGIDYDSWDELHDMDIDNGAVFLMNPDALMDISKEIIIGQFTIRDGSTKRGKINIQGKFLTNYGNVADNSWKQENIEFVLNQPNTLSNGIPINCETWYDGCNTCRVSNGILGACTRMMCFREDTPYCMSFNSGH